MFHRRLVLLAGIMAVIGLLLTSQLVRLSVVEGAVRRAEAESRLLHESFLNQPRAEILDRKGRIVARDVACYDVAVEYEVITDAWPVNQATRKARRELGSRWQEFSPEERAAAIMERLPEFDQQVAALWDAVKRLGGLTRAELDDRCDEIKRQVQRRAERVWDRRRAMEESKHGRADDRHVRRPIQEQKQPHVILPRVSDEVAFEFRHLATIWPGTLEVQDSTRREYPWSTQRILIDRSTLPMAIRDYSPIEVEVIGVADHVLGSMREVWAADMERRPFVDRASARIDLGGYRRGDVTGSRGLELTFEAQLRGRRGALLHRLDSEEDEVIDRVPGTPLRTTLDVQLQARVQAILSPQVGLTRVSQYQAGWAEGVPRATGLPLGTPLNSAAVVMEVETGQILAMVSMPTIAMGEMMEEAQRQRAAPYVNRAVEAIYPPGSIIKPLVLAAAVNEGVLSLDGSIECVGHYFADRKDVARCWIYREHYGLATHGSVECVGALAQSCNIFFFTLADRLGMDRLTRWYRSFGMGQPLDVGLLSRVQASDGGARMLGESAGQLPSGSDIEASSRRGALPFETIIMGIGQGPVTWTPVQAANAYATIARRGVMRDATLVPDEDRPRLAPSRPDLRLSDRLVEKTLEGLRQSVEERHGTGSRISYPDGTAEPIINAPGVVAWAKTGTAQAPPTKFTTDEGDEQSVSNLSHAWFVGLVGDRGARSPRYVIAVVIEHAGSGGRAAGPVANQIIRALQQEGYLRIDGGGA